MNCPACQRENPAFSRFCLGCGHAFAATCQSCNAELPRDAAYCNRCGRRLGELTAERDPRSYTPKHLADKILQTKAALEGERKQVTVLFADVKDSLELAQELDPEEWHEILERFFQILTEGVHHFEGTVNQYTGDGIMALFGAPIAHEDHAQRACHAALRIRDGLRRLADELRAQHALQFGTRIGLNSGEVIVGKIGDDLRMDYTAQGHTVGLASRAEQLAEPGRVCLTEATAALVEGFFELRDLGSMRVKGVRQPVRIHTLEGPGPMRTRIERARMRGLSAFTGREREVETLDRALEQALAGAGQVVGIVGEAGVGKSRLCLEFVTACRDRGLRVDEAHCPSHGKTEPFGAILQLLRAALDLDRDPRGDRARDRVEGLLRELDPGLAESLPLVLDFLGLSDPQSRRPQMDPNVRERRLFRFVRRLVRLRGRGEPSVILVDDAHWIDDPSDRFLAEIAAAVQGTRTLLLVNFRPEYTATWMSGAEYRQISLRPLAQNDAETLLTRLLGRAASTAALSERIGRHTAGNPFFIEEVVQSLAETGALEGQPGSYRLAQPIETLAIPATVQTVLGARIDRLPERDKHVLQTAAVIGKEVPEALLAHVEGLPELELADALDQLRRGDFLYEAALAPEPLHAFKHPLTQEVAYHSQLRGRSSQVHARVAEAVRELHADALDENAALLAHHWEAAGDALEAGRWHRRAAERAATRDQAEALRHWRAVRRLAESLPESTEVLRLAATACGETLQLGWRLGLTEAEIDALFREGRALGERAGDVRSLALLIDGYGAIRVHSGDVEGFRGYAVEALELAERTDDRGLRAFIEHDVAWTDTNRGNLRESLTRVERSLQLLDGDPTRVDDPLATMAHGLHACFRGVLLARLGRLTEAREQLDGALDYAREQHDLETVVRALTDRATLSLIQGLTERAMDDAGEARRIAEELGVPLSLATSDHVLGTVHLQAERWTEASATLERSLSRARDSRTYLDREAGILADLAEAYLGATAKDRARAYVEQALELAERHGVLHRCRSRLASARVTLSCDGAHGADGVRAALDSARSLARQMGAICFDPHIGELQARLALVLGDEPEHARCLAEARDLYQEMGATGHAERLAQALGTHTTA